MSDDLTPTKRYSNSRVTSVEEGTGSKSDDRTEFDETQQADSNEDRGSWGNQLEFLLSTLGMAVGLGNIWRFPTRAYSNGGSAFLIPYILCAFLFGLPAMYLEFLLGQYHRTTAPIIFRRIAPVLQGVGWMAVAVSSLVAIYYIIVIGWSTVYISSIIGGHTSLWNRCDNDWNDPETCLDLMKQKTCINYSLTTNYTTQQWGNSSEDRGKSFVFFNNSCIDKVDMVNITTVTASEQYFFNYIVQPSKGFLDFNLINFRSLIGTTVCWIIVALIIWKGVNYMGKASYVIVTLPYFIVCILFIRGITLDGASDGIYFYLGKPDWSKVFEPATWGEALKQLCFSLGIGYGGMIGLSSFNKPENNCYKDALIVIFGDTIMSLIGGAAVFSTLGFLAKEKGCEVSDVVNSGLSLAFVAFPEAMGQMPLPSLWSFLFFLMIFFLGISTEVAYVNVFCSAICDQFLTLRKRKWLVVVLWSGVLYSIGLVMITDGGYYWFIMFDEYAAGVSSCVSVTSEVLVIAYVYGRKNMLNDMLEMFGPAKSKFARYLGIHTPYFGINWMFISPILGMILIVLASIRDYPYEGKPDVYPIHFDIVGWFVCALPVLMVPLFAVLAYFEFKNNHYDLRGLFMWQRQLKSYPRIYRAMTAQQKELHEILPEREPWDNKSTRLFRRVSDDNIRTAICENESLISHKEL